MEQLVEPMCLHVKPVGRLTKPTLGLDRLTDVKAAALMTVATLVVVVMALTTLNLREDSESLVDVSAGVPLLERLTYKWGRLIVYLLHFRNINSNKDNYSNKTFLRKR